MAISTFKYYCTTTILIMAILKFVLVVLCETLNPLIPARRPGRLRPRGTGASGDGSPLMEPVTRA